MSTAGCGAGLITGIVAGSNSGGNEPPAQPPQLSLTEPRIPLVPSDSPTTTTRTVVITNAHRGRQHPVGALSVDAAGVVTIAGQTVSPDYPTTLSAWNPSYNGGGDAFVSRLDPSLPGPQQLLYSTFIGGNMSDWAFSVWSDTAGVLTIAGSTASANYPTTAGAFSTVNTVPACANTRRRTRACAGQQVRSVSGA